MARIGLTEGFTVIPKGTHVFKITAVKYKEDFGKMEVTMQTASGAKHIERFSLMGKDGEVNEGAMNAFSFFAKTALNDFNVQEIDEQDLVGHFMRCEVDHEKVESNKTPGKYVTFVRLTEKLPADGFDEETSKKAEPSTSVTESKKSFDLNSILG